MDIWGAIVNPSLVGNTSLWLPLYSNSLISLCRPLLGSVRTTALHVAAAPHVDNAVPVSNDPISPNPSLTFSFAAVQISILAGLLYD